MAVNSTFYLNAASLSLATAVYLDTSLSLIAPNGFYGDGTIVRQQVSGVLLSNLPSDCSPVCGTNIMAPASQGLYLISSDLGADLGAVIIEFFVQSVPDGLRAEYNGTTYNKLSSNFDGVHQSTTPGNFTIVGDSTVVGSCSSWYPSGGTVVLTEYLYDGPSFAPTGNTPSVTIVAGDISLSASSPQKCIMVVPKIAASPNLIDVQIFAGCTSTAWDVNVKCPALLPSFPSSDRFTGPLVPCATPLPNTFYFAKVHLALDSYVGIYDYVFSDVNGQFPLLDGFYLTSNVATPNQVIEVDNGVVIAITNCV
jgi:hypothetical protein